eukprot:6520369-Alexandrium_andersonii.AAC.1
MPGTPEPPGKATPPSGSGASGRAAPGPATGPKAYMSSRSGCVPGAASWSPSKETTTGTAGP